MAEKKTETKQTQKKRDEYVTLYHFYDTEDGNKEYQANKPYPRPANKKIDPDRLKELSSHDNKFGSPVIRKK